MATLPADQFLTLTQLNVLFQNVTLGILGHWNDVEAWDAYIAARGMGYSVNDILTIEQEGASGGTIKVLSVNAQGSPQTLQTISGGTGYFTANNVPCSGGTGTGLLLNIEVEGLGENPLGEEPLGLSMGLVSNVIVMSQPGINPYNFARISWPTGGAPAWGITEDIVFIQIVEVPNLYSEQLNTKYLPLDNDNVNQQTSFTRVLEVNWVFYGPNSYDYASSVRPQIGYQLFHDILARQGVYLIPGHYTPKRIPELFEGQWWDRSDVTMPFNVLTVRNLEVPYIIETDITVIGSNSPNSETYKLTGTSPLNNSRRRR